MLDEAIRKHMGNKVNGEHIFSIKSAHEITIIGESVKSLQILLTKISDTAKDFIMKRNPSKTKVMVRNFKKKYISIEETSIKQVQL